MKKTLLLVLGLCWVVASAQAGPLKVRLGAGPTFPMGNAADFLITGIHGLVGAELEAAPKVSVLADLTYHSIAYKEIAGSPDPVPFHFVGGMVGLKYALSAAPAVKPYLKAAMGVASVRTTNFIGVKNQAYTYGKFSYELGAGFDAGMLFVEASYQVINTNDNETDVIPLTAGVRF